LGQADSGDLRIGVDRARNSPVVDDRVVAGRVLGGDLALPEGGMRELPVARAVADGVDVANRRAPALVRGDPLALVELDADLLEAEVLDRRASPDRDEHQIALDRLAVAEVHGQPAAGVFDLRAL